MAETVFRKKSMDRITSPDQLNDYIRLPNPGVWFIMAAIIIILAGGCAFGYFGHIDSTVPAVVVSEEGRALCLVKKEYEDRFTDDMKVKIDGKSYDAALKAQRAVKVPAKADDYTLYLGKLREGEWVYEVDVKGSLPDGSYEALLVTEQISPLYFLFNES